MRVRKLDAYNDQIKLAYENGAGLHIIATTYGVSVGTIRNILIRLGVPLKGRGRPKEQPIYVNKPSM